jgi:tripartite-type tricarboxylate transporter receptor subunit TctC
VSTRSPSWIRLWWTAAGLVLANICAAEPALTDWPERTVRIITGPLAPGSSIDGTARIVGDELAKKWIQPVTIENRPGADGIAAEISDVLAVPAVITTLANIGMAARGTSPGEFAAALNEQRTKWDAIAHEHSLKPVR